MKKIKALEIIFIAIAIFIVASEGVKPNYFTVWNLLPILAFYFLLKNGLPFWKNTKIKITLILTGVALLLFPVAVHVMWLFDMGKTKTGSSTAGLIFIFIPSFAFLVAILPALVQLVYVFILKNKE